MAALIDKLPLGPLKRVAPLGLRLFDPVINRIVTEGITVMAWPAKVPDKKYKAYCTPAGIFAFINLPGLREYEFGKKSFNEIIAASPERFDFTIDITDTSGRYLPLRLNECSLPERGLLPNPAESPSPPDASGTAIMLFPSSVYPVPSTFARIRVQLWEGLADVPAAWVLLTVSIKGKTYYGMSGTDGQALIAFPYPEPESRIAISPPSPPGQEKCARWNLMLSARYAALPVDEQPSLKDIFSQSVACLWEQFDETVCIPLPVQSLVQGTDLIISSDNSDKTRLFITRTSTTGSPP